MKVCRGGGTVDGLSYCCSLQGGKKEPKKEMAKIEKKRSTDEKDEEERNKRGEGIVGEESLIDVRQRN